MPSPIYDTEAEGIDEVEGNYFIDSNKFLYGVLCACVVVQIWNRLWLLHFLPIPLVYYGLKKLCTKVGIEDYFNKKFKEQFLDFYSDLQDPSSGETFSFSTMNPKDLLFIYFIFSRTNLPNSRSHWN